MTFAQPPALLMSCPKCATEMRTIERSGIHIETCPACRGVFLDRGELDRLLDLEAGASAGQRAQSAASRDDRMGPDRGSPSADADRWSRRDRDDDDDDDDDGRGRWGDDRRTSRRGGFLSELFENFGS